MVVEIKRRLELLLSNRGRWGLAGLALLVIGFEGALHNPQLLTILLVLLGTALSIRVAWVQRVLGFLAAGVALAGVLWPLGAGHAANDWARW